MIFSVLLWLYKKEIRRGKLIFLYLALYCPCRFFLGFFRGDVYRGILFGISTSQWISIIIMLTLIALSLTKTEKRTGNVADRGFDNKKQAMPAFV